MLSWRERAFKPADLAAHMRYLCGDDRAARLPRVSLLIGAGCSVTAGIPAAGAIVRDHLRPHPLLQNAGKPKDGVSEYAYLMEKLPAADRIRVIDDCIKKSMSGDPERTNLNWAHLLIATLVDQGFVTQILTTNFDPLLVDAMALADLPIRVFDLTAADFYMPGRAGRGSITYLHGQSHGLLQTHTKEETELVRRHIRTALQEALTHSTMIVVGYSGDNDLIFEELRDCFPQFRHRLYWVHYDPDNRPPVPQVVKFLEDPRREAFAVVDDDSTLMDADTAFIRLAIDELKLNLPSLVLDPLAHARRSLNRVKDFPRNIRGGGDPSPFPRPNPVETARERIDRANELLNQEPATHPAAPSSTLPPPLADGASPSQAADGRDLPLELELAMAGMTEDVEAVRKLSGRVTPQSPLSVRRGFVRAALASADKLILQQEFSVALELLSRAREVGCDAFLESWVLVTEGNALSDQALTKSGPEADGLFTSSYQKYEDALRIKPDKHEALINWGNALTSQARTKSGPEADVLFTSSYQKYEAALRLKSDKHEALYNWGTALLAQARTKSGPEADVLFTSSYQKLEAALRLKPDDHKALFNMACLHALQGDAATCVATLERRRAVLPPLTRAELDGDRDFDRVRSDPVFVAFRESLAV